MCNCATVQQCFQYMEAGSGTVSYAGLNGVGMVVGTREWLEGFGNAFGDAR
jgi:hypothetical protein